MNQWRTQRGNAPVGCIVASVVAIIVAIIVIKAAPVMINIGEFDKTIKAQADRANRVDYNDARIKKNILSQAEDLDLPVKEKAVIIERSSSFIKIIVTYDMALEFPFYTYRWTQEHRENRPLFSG